MANARLKVLFAGGCHIDGYPVGKDISLTKVARRLTPDDVFEPFITLSYANLKSTAKIAETCTKESIDILVLQIGHYESPRPLTKAWRRQHRPSKKPVLGRDVPFEPQPGLEFRPSLKGTFRSWVRLFNIPLLMLTGRIRNLFYRKNVEQLLDSCLTDLDKLPLKAILLMTPLTCPDGLVCRYRRKAYPLFVAAAQKHDCVLVDTYKLLEDCDKANYIRQFADYYHMSRFGHERVGTLIAKHLNEAAVKINQKTSK
jgi:hypothetical protein